MANSPLKVRIGWVDALRGFTMILVVAFHVCQDGFSLSPSYSSSMPVLKMFRLPLFFFISGLLSYKASAVWSWSQLGRMVLKKLRVQVVPTLVFFTIFIMTLYRNWQSVWWKIWYTETKAGYWFTLALLYMFIVYYLFEFLLSRLRYSGRWGVIVLFAVSLLFCISCYQPAYCSWALGYRGEQCEWIICSSLRMAMVYFPFFLLGNIVRRNWPLAERVMDSRWLMPLLVVVATVSTFDYVRWFCLREEWRALSLMAARFSLMAVVFMAFRHYQDFFSTETRIGRGLQYIGRRTLDIYLLHFLFIPRLPEVGAYFKAHSHNFVADTTLSIIVSLLVIGFCIVTSNVLRVSPFLKKWLFGRDK